MEGHFIRGYGDSQKPQAEIELLPGAAAPATNAEETIARIHAWNPRKQQVFRPEHIRVAWQQLEEQGWMHGEAARGPQGRPEQAAS